MLIPDKRTFADRMDIYSTCRKCGCGLVILPDDKRQGFCFDCYDPLTNDDNPALYRGRMMFPKRLGF